VRIEVAQTKSTVNVFGIECGENDFVGCHGAYSSTAFSVIIKLVTQNIHNMKGFVPPDPLTKVSTIKPAVVFAPSKNSQSKRKNKRFSANCVFIKDSEEQAMAQAKPDESYYSAKVLGPSKSTEGHFIYYLDCWLEE